MSADGGAFICQSQSLNPHVAEPSPGKLTPMHPGGKKRSRRAALPAHAARADVIAFTVDRPRRLSRAAERALPVNTEPKLASRSH